MSIVGPRPLVENEVDVHTLRKEKNVYMLGRCKGLAQTMGKIWLEQRKKLRLMKNISGAFLA